MRLGKVCIVLAALVILALVHGQDEKKTGAKNLKSPVAYTKKSIGQGRTVYARYCTSCHGADGKATVDVVADATDLTAPKVWKQGTSEGEIFRSIRDGAGDTMPAFKSQVSKEEDIWHLVNFIRSLWPEAQRPPLEEKKDESKQKEGRRL